MISSILLAAGQSKRMNGENKLIKESIIDGLNEYGNSASASHLISGHYQIHDDLESFAASLLGF